jgi:hypothetical protein
MLDTRLILEAIALKKCLMATYNRVDMKLAPHVLYTRHGDLHMDAVALTKAGAPPKYKKLGAFRLSGLSHVALTDEHFAVDALYLPDAERYAGETLLAIEP